MRLGRSLSFAVAMLASGTAFAGAPGWSISESSGQVLVVSTGVVKAAVRGGGVATGDIINTGRNGRAVLVRGEEYLVVSPNTRIRVADPAKSGGFTQIIEDFGNVIYKIKKMTMPHFAVETPFLAAVVKGTTFSVTVTEKGASVQVTEGRVEVATRDGGASFMVLPGDIGSVSANAPATLNMQGRENRTITSPTPAAATAAVTASVNNQAVAPDQVQMSGKIDSPVGEGAVDLSAMSEGMVMGDSSMKAMTSMMKMAAMETPVPPPTPTAAETGTSVVTATAVILVETAPTALPPTPADVAQSGDQPPPAGPPQPVAALPPPAPAATIDPIEVIAAPPAPTPTVVPLPPTPAPPVDLAPVPLPPAPQPSAEPVPAPLPPTPAVEPAPAPVTSPLPAPAPIEPLINNGNGNGLLNNNGNNSNNSWTNGNGRNGSGSGSPGNNSQNGRIDNLNIEDD
jgi:hypothetical protein